MGPVVPMIPDVVGNDWGCEEAAGRSLGFWWVREVHWM